MSGQAIQLEQPLERPNIAIVASSGMGDGLVYLILANNLYRNGFDVTLYNNHISQLQAWLPHLTCKAYLPQAILEQDLTQFDTVISDVSTPLTCDRDPALIPQLAQKYIFLSTLKIKPEFVADHSARIEALAERKAESLQHIAKCSGLLRVSEDDTLSMVDHTVYFCDHKLRLADVIEEIGFKIPSDLIFQKHKKRILIHPTSSNDKKSWLPGHFIALARRLKKNGYQVEFTVLPKEREEWLKLTQGEFSVPRTETIADLAAYIYESRALIGNDSGNGHLASALGLPVLSIYRKKHDNFRWRPGWGPNTIVRPPLTLKFFGNRIWKPFLSVERVYKAFIDFLA